MQTDEKPGECIHSKYRWADTALVPRHDSVGWAILKGTRRIHCDDANQVLTKLKGWSPLHGLLVGMPGSSCFVPPICVPRLRGA